MHAISLVLPSDKGEDSYLRICSSCNEVSDLQASLCLKQIFQGVGGLPSIKHYKQHYLYNASLSLDKMLPHGTKFRDGKDDSEALRTLMVSIGFNHI